MGGLVTWWISDLEEFWWIGLQLFNRMAWFDIYIYIFSDNIYKETPKPSPHELGLFFYRFPPDVIGEKEHSWNGTRVPVRVTAWHLWSHRVRCTLITPSQ